MGMGKEIVMARNRYAGYCYKCKQFVPVGYGHFEKRRDAPGWRIQCVKCASGRIVTDDDPCVIQAKKMNEDES